MKKVFLLLAVILSSIPAHSQARIAIEGYLSDMQSVISIPEEGLLWQNQLQNRLNLDFYPTSWLSGSLQVRSRFLNGSPLLTRPGNGDDAGFFDLTLSGNGLWKSGPAYLWSAMIDRAWLELSFGSLVIKAGRQRINWGQTFVWNPNDLFNSYSFFDVDYPERPGSDALLVQYYTGSASDIEAAIKLDSAGALTAAGYFRFNTRGYDIQLLGGVLSSEDLVAGFGWSGAFGGVSFRGEASYFRKLEFFADTVGTLMLSTGLDYTFESGLFLQGEVLYSGFAKNSTQNSLMSYLASDLNVKNLGFTPWTYYAGIAYPLSPLLQGSFSGMLFPEWRGFYLGPSFDLSLADNHSLSLIGQFFTLAPENPLTGERERQNFFLAFLRLKANF